MQAMDEEPTNQQQKQDMDEGKLSRYFNLSYFSSSIKILSHFGCKFGLCNQQLEACVNCEPEAKSGSGKGSVHFSHRCKFLRRPPMYNSWGNGRKTTPCPAVGCNTKFQILSLSEPQRFNINHLVKHVLEKHVNNGRVYPEVVQYLKQNTNMTVEEINKQMCIEYLKLVWPSMFHFQPCITYPFVWPKEQISRGKTLQDISIQAEMKVKLKVDEKRELDQIMEQFKKQHFDDADDFNYEKDGKVIKFVLSYKRDYQDLDTRFKIMQKIQEVIKKIRKEKPRFLVSIEDRGVRPGSIETIFLCVVRKDNESEFQNFLQTKIVYMAELEGETPMILPFDYNDNVYDAESPLDGDASGLPISQSNKRSSENSNEAKSCSPDKPNVVQNEGVTHNQDTTLRPATARPTVNPSENPTSSPTRNPTASPTFSATQAPPSQKHLALTSRAA